MTNKITRRTARESAVKLVFAHSINNEENAEEFYTLAVAEHEIAANDFTRSLFFGVLENKEKIDEAISAHASGWKMSRISKMSLAIMRVCTYELLFTDVPKEIAINEAVEIAKAYDNDGAPAFINGILNSVSKAKGVAE